MNKAVFLDRDGTINEEKNYLYRSEEFRYLPGVIDGLKDLSEMGFLLVIITNQSGIARGYYTEADFYKLNLWMMDDLETKGIKIAAVYYCPHYLNGIVDRYSVECDCRKPKTGLFWKAAEDLNIDMENSFAIGDKMRDLSITEESDVKGILLTSTDIIKENYNREKIHTCRTFPEAVRIIENWQKN